MKKGKWFITIWIISLIAACGPLTPANSVEVTEFVPTTMQITPSMTNLLTQQQSPTFTLQPFTPTPKKVFQPNGVITFSDVSNVWIVEVGTKATTDPISDSSHIYKLPSGDGKGYLYFLSDLGRPHGIQQVYRMLLDGSNMERLTLDNSYDDWLVVSPDGNRIAYSSWRDPIV